MSNDMITAEYIAAMERCKEEIASLRNEISYLRPKADAYDMLAVVVRLLPQPGVSMGEDLVWKLNKRIRELRPQVGGKE